MNRLHPLSAVTTTLNTALVGASAGFAIAFGLSVAVGAEETVLTVILVPLGLILGAAYGIARYLRFEYGITPDTFDVSSGVFSRRSREIPYRRIQNVDVKQSVIQRVLDLAVVSIETAGGGETEASLNFVSRAEASRLQAQIRRRTAETRSRDRSRHADGTPSDEQVTDEQAQVGHPDRTEADLDAPHSDDGDGSRDARLDWSETTPERPKPLFALRAKELLLYSFTSIRPAAVASVIFVFFLATDLIVEYLVTVSQPVGGPDAIGDGTTANYGVLTIVSAAHGVVVTYFLSVAYTFTMYYEFQLARVGEDFVYERGLLQRYSGSIPVEKVQSVTITDNPAQRLIGYAGMWIETAGYGPESNSDSQSAVPLAREKRVYTFTERLTGVETPTFERPPPMARRRYLVRYSVLAAVLVAVAYVLTIVTAFEQWYLAAVVFAAVPPAAHLRYVHLGYFVGEEDLVIRRGFWRRRTTVIPYYRIQTVNVRRSIFQRRLGLASLAVDTASSRTFFWATPTIYDIELDAARSVQGTSRKHLQTALRERAASDDVGFSVDFT